MTVLAPCSILTTTPNAVTSAVHDRMPVILDPNAYELWLDPGMNDVGAASELLRPYDAQTMQCFPVSTRINSVVYDDAACSAPVELGETQNWLFLWWRPTGEKEFPDRCVMAIKYAGLRGKEVHVIGKNRSTRSEEDTIQ
jgi:SOS response associated peptidase (SRAP)